MLTKSQILQIVVVLSFLVAGSMSVMSPQYEPGATKIISFQQAKANPYFFDCDALARAKYQKRFKEKLGKIVQIRIFNDNVFFTIYERPKGRVEIKSYFRYEARIDHYQMMTSGNQKREFYMDNDEQDNQYNIQVATGKPVIPKAQRDEQSDYLTEELKSLPGFKKCDKAIREKYQEELTLGKIRQIKMQIQQGLRFTIIYESMLPLPIKAIATYDKKKGTVTIQHINMDPDSAQPQLDYLHRK